MTNAWTMPIKNRIDMLSTGMRTPVGIKVFGADLAEIERDRHATSRRILRDVPGTRSVFAERAAGGYFLDFDLEARRARPLRPNDRRRADDVIMHGDRRRERHDDHRGPRALLRSTCATRASCATTSTQLGARRSSRRRTGAQVPLGQVADIQLVAGPVDDPRRERPPRRLRLRRLRHGQRDIGGYVDEAKRASPRGSAPTPGYSLVWSGQYENMPRVRERLKIVVPLTLAPHLRSCST